MLAIAEAYPFAKTGGLGDVGAALPKALARRGHDVRLVLPGYPSLATGRPAEVLPLRVGRRNEHVALHHNGRHDGVDVWSVHHARHFSAASPYVGSLYEADVDPFVVFSVATAELARRWRPDVVHVHDWHPALAPQLMRARARRHELDGCAAVLTIHNLAYQGRRAIRGASSRAAARGSLLAQGIAHVDELNTVSASYRDEILTPIHGEGLDTLLLRRRDRLRAIRNGVDYEHFDPARDQHLDPRYDATTLERKQEHKLALQRRHGLEIDAGAPLFGMVSRLVEQKGLDLLFAGLRRILASRAQIIVAGVGEHRYEQALMRAVRRWPGRLVYVPDPREPLARRVYAASDFFLCPSRFEPLGLAPLIALRYGAVPVVRATGGLAETITDVRLDGGGGLGVTFGPADPTHLVDAVQAALALYADPVRFRRVQLRGMRAEFSWTQAAGEYERMYGDALARRRMPLRAIGA